MNYKWKSGLNENTDVVQGLTPSPSKRDNIDLRKLITGIWTAFGPFLTDFQDEKLYCISQVR